MPDNVHTKYLLTEDEMPRAWYNILPDLPKPPEPVLHPGTKQPVTPDDLAPLFPMSLIMQEVSTEPYIEIPEPVRQVYRQWRPSPLFRARRLEKALDTPARIYYKYEGVSPVGSHKANTSVGPGDGGSLLRDRSRNFHGQDQLPAEAISAQPHANF